MVFEVLQEVFNSLFTKIAEGKDAIALPVYNHYTTVHFSDLRLVAKSAFSDLRLVAKNL
jgi:pantothenate kinase